MTKIFDDLVAGYFQPFSAFTPDQEKCRAFTKVHMDEILQMRQRDKFINDVRVCVAGLGTADEKEPLEDANFSQYQFYRPFIEDLVYFEEKFDFLIKCVGAGVCRVQTGFEERYQHTLLKVLTFREVPPLHAPPQVLDLMQPKTPRTVAEEPGSPEQQQERLDEYRNRKSAFTKGVRAELFQLEEEQRRCENEKRRATNPMAQGAPVEWGDKGHLDDEKQQQQQPKTVVAADCDQEAAPVDNQQEVVAGVKTMVTAKELLKQRGQQEKLKEQNEERKAKEEQDKKQKEGEQQEAAAAAEDEPSEEEKKQLLDDFNQDKKALKVLGFAQKKKLAQRRAKEDDQGAADSKEEAAAAEGASGTVTANNGEIISTPYLDLLSSFSKTPTKSKE